MLPSKAGWKEIYDMKRVLCLALALVMVLGMVPALGVGAADNAPAQLWVKDCYETPFWFTSLETAEDWGDHFTFYDAQNGNQLTMTSYSFHTNSELSVAVSESGEGYADGSYYIRVQGTGDGDLFVTANGTQYILHITAVQDTNTPGGGDEDGGNTPTEVGLYISGMDYSETNGHYPSGDYSTVWNMEESRSGPVLFYFYNGSENSVIPAGKLSATENLQLSYIEPELGSAFFDLKALDAGTGTISYAAPGGKVYTLTVNISEIDGGDNPGGDEGGGEIPDSDRLWAKDCYENSSWFTSLETGSNWGDNFTFYTAQGGTKLTMTSYEFYTESGNINVTVSESRGDFPEGTYYILVNGVGSGTLLITTSEGNYRLPISSHDDGSGTPSRPETPIVNINGVDYAISLGDTQGGDRLLLLSPGMTLGGHPGGGWVIAAMSGYGTDAQTEAPPSVYSHIKNLSWEMKDFTNFVGDNDDCNGTMIIGSEEYHGATLPKFIISAEEGKFFSMDIVVKFSVGDESYEMPYTIRYFDETRIQLDGSTLDTAAKLNNALASDNAFFTWMESAGYGEEKAQCLSCIENGIGLIVDLRLPCVVYEDIIECNVSGNLGLHLIGSEGYLPRDTGAQVGGSARSGSGSTVEEVTYDGNTYTWTASTAFHPTNNNFTVDSPDGVCSIKYYVLLFDYGTSQEAPEALYDLLDPEGFSAYALFNKNQVQISEIKKEGYRYYFDIEITGAYNGPIFVCGKLQNGTLLESGNGFTVKLEGGGNEDSGNTPGGGNEDVGQLTKTTMPGIRIGGYLSVIRDVCFVADPELKQSYDGKSFTCAVLCDAIPSILGVTGFVNSIEQCLFDGFDYAYLTTKTGYGFQIYGSTFQNCGVGICLDSPGDHGSIPSLMDTCRFIDNEIAVQVKAIPAGKRPYDYSMVECDFIDNEIDFDVDNPGVFYFYRNYYGTIINRENELSPENLRVRTARTRYDYENKGTVVVTNPRRLMPATFGPLPGILYIDLLVPAATWILENQVDELVLDSSSIEDGTEFSVVQETGGDEPEIQYSWEFDKKEDKKPR